jgi:hypothetical protein
VEAETATDDPLDLEHLQPPVVVLPIQTWSSISLKALTFAYTLSSDVRAVHVSAEGDTGDDFCRRWPRYAGEPARKAGLRPAELVVIPSPYRWVIRPIVEYVFQMERELPDRKIAVVIPELVERHWYHYFLHNQRAEILKALLMVRGNERIVVVSVPWYLKA